MSPFTLKESYWAQENQLWLATGGFGCSPTAAGRAVYVNRMDLERNLPHSSKAEDEDERRAYPVSGHGGISHEPAQEKSRRRSGKQMKTFAEEDL